MSSLTKLTINIGTKVGDPIEATALYNVLGKDRLDKKPLYIGSVKSNIGHCEGASGVISVIKTAMMLERGFILPNINFENANPSIPLKKWNMKVSILLVINSCILFCSALIYSRKKHEQCTDLRERFRQVKWHGQLRNDLHR